MLVKINNTDITKWIITSSYEVNMEDVENTWEIKISCLISVSGHYDQERGKSSMFKRNKKINKERFSYHIFILEHPREN